MQGPKQNSQFQCCVASIMPNSHRWHVQYKTVFSCPCRRCEQNWQQVKTVGDRKFRNCFVQSRDAVRTTENSLDLSTILFTPPTRQDSCRLCELDLRVETGLYADISMFVRHVMLHLLNCVSRSLDHVISDRVTWSSWDETSTTRL